MAERMIARVDAFDMIAQRERELMSAPMLSQDATDSSENADPMLSTEPTDPMLRIEPTDPMLASESTDLRDAYESAESAPRLRLAMPITLLRKGSAASGGRKPVHRATDTPICAHSAGTTGIEATQKHRMRPGNVHLRRLGAETAQTGVRIAR